MSQHSGLSLRLTLALVLQMGQKYLKDDLSWATPAPAVDAANVTYTPGDATDWNSDTDPGDVDNALDQLADRVVTLEGGAGHAALSLDADAATFLDLSTQELGLDVQTKNTVFAGPTTGAANEPTFRALVAADIIDLVYPVGALISQL